MFNVTYEIITPESAEAGDAEERGFVAENVSLRDAIELVRETRTAQVDGVESIETDEWPMRAPCWVSVINGMEYQTGAQETRSLHMPDNLTPATRCRIARLVGAR